MPTSTTSSTSATHTLPAIAQAGLKLRAVLRNTRLPALSAFHARYDLWLSPTLAAPPPPIGSLATPPALAMVSDVVSRLGLAGWLSHTPQFKQTVLSNLGWTPYTQLANLTGRPAMSVPLW